MQVTSTHLQKNGITINSGPLEVNVSESTTLTCIVLPSTSKPAPTIVWYIGSSVKQSSTSTTYTFTPSKTDHDKIIYCEAYNLQSASEAKESAKPKLFVRGNVFKFIWEAHWKIWGCRTNIGGLLPSWDIDGLI